MPTSNATVASTSSPQERPCGIILILAYVRSGRVRFLARSPANRGRISPIGRRAAPTQSIRPRRAIQGGAVVSLGQRAMHGGRPVGPMPRAPKRPTLSSPTQHFPYPCGRVTAEAHHDPMTNRAHGLRTPIERTTSRGCHRPNTPLGSPAKQPEIPCDQGQRPDRRARWRRCHQMARGAIAQPRREHMVRVTVAMEGPPCTWLS